MSKYRRNHDSPATVLILGNTADLADLYGQWLRSTYNVKATHDCSTALRLLDEDIDVALLDRRSPSGMCDEVLTTISERDLGCQIGVVTSKPTDDGLFELDFDEYLCTPTTKREVHGTVQSLLAQHDYNDAIQEFYELSSTKEALEENHSKAELESNQRYTEIQTSIEALEEEIAAMTEALTDSQFHATSLWNSSEEVEIGEPDLTSSQG